MDEEIDIETLLERHYAYPWVDGVFVFFDNIDKLWGVKVLQQQNEDDFIDIIHAGSHTCPTMVSALAASLYACKEVNETIKNETHWRVYNDLTGEEITD